MTEGFLPCSGGPFHNQLFQAGDDVPEGWRITLTVPIPKKFAGIESMDIDDSICDFVKGVYVRKGDRLIWEAGIE